MNKIVLTGRLTKDPELRFTPGSGAAVTNFSIAVDDGFGDNKKTYFFNVVVWNKQAEAVANYTHKGSKVLVSGRLTNKEWQDNAGNKRIQAEIVADPYGGIEFLESKNSNNQNNAGSYSNEYSAPSNDAFGAGSFEEDITPVDDGDMPF